MGMASVDVGVTNSKTAAAASASAASTVRRSSHQSAASTVMTESGTTSTTASVVTLSPPPSTRTQQLMDDDEASHNHACGSSLPPSIASSWLRSSLVSGTNASSSSNNAVADVARSAPSSSSIMTVQQKIKNAADKAPSEIEQHASPEDSPTQIKSATAASRREVALRSRSSRSAHNVASGPPMTRGPLNSTSSAVDRRLIDKYERVNSEIERVIRATNADGNSENGELLKQVRSEMRKAKRNSSQIIQSQKDLLEKMERHERGGIRRMFSMNREHKMEKLRHKLCEKLNQSVAAEEQLGRLERQSVSLTRMSFGSMCGMVEFDELSELSELEREREDLLSNLISSAGLTDAQELHSRLALFSSEKRACDCAMKQVEQCETAYRKALHLLRIALSTILGPTYSGGLKEFVLGPYPLAVEASQLIEQACRSIQPESRRRYKAYTPDLSSVRPPKFPQPMIDFAKRGTRSNFDPSNSAAVTAMRNLRTSENVVILLQRIVIAKLELIEKWRRDVERDLESADDGYRKVDARLQEHMARLTRTVSAA